MTTLLLLIAAWTLIRMLGILAGAARALADELDTFER